jgi:hypothetical protein
MSGNGHSRTCGSGPPLVVGDHARRDENRIHAPEDLDVRVALYVFVPSDVIPDVMR